MFVFFTIYTIIVGICIFIFHNRQCDCPSGIYTHGQEDDKPATIRKSTMDIWAYQTGAKVKRVRTKSVVEPEPSGASKMTLVEPYEPYNISVVWVIDQ